LNKDEALEWMIENNKLESQQPAQEPLTRAQQVIRANNTAQPTQEPVSKTAERDYNFMRDLAIGTENILNEMLSAKPVAWTKESELQKTTTLRNPILMWKNQYTSIENNIPLYIHPHQWQGLTDDEIKELTHDGVADEYDIKFARAIEAKLKEKIT